MTETHWFFGGDPGKSGGVAVVSASGLAYCWKMPESEVDMLALMREIRSRFNPAAALIEHVHSMPGQGVKSMFSFGLSYGRLRMATLAAGIGFNDIRPRKWQGCVSGNKPKTMSQPDWKRALKAKAQQLYPEVKVTLATADALLIARASLLQHATASRYSEQPIIAL